MSNKTFVYPQKTLKQARSKFKMPHQVKTSFLHGYCNVYDCFEVLPGDTFSLDVASLIRMSTPIAPIMDNITMHLAAYFVPSRLVYDNFEQLMGANKTGAWTADDNAYSIPYAEFPGSQAGTVGTLGDQFGLAGHYDEYNALPGRAYYLIWNEFYRNQNTTAPFAVDHSSANRVLVDDSTISGGTSAYNIAPQKLGKYADPFTKCLPEPQKHDPVQFIPQDLQVGLIPAGNASGTIGSNVTVGVPSGTDYVKGEYLDLGLLATNTGLGDADLIAKVDEAWNNINSLRFAFQLQKFYEKDARFGTRYFELLNGHFGVTNSDLVLQRPQFLGEMNWRINIDQVLSTAGYAASSSTTVGAPGANSVTVKKGSLFTGSFTEHGYIIIVGGTRHDHTYPGSVAPMWFRKDRLDFYDPVFANIGEQPLYLYNLNSFSLLDDESISGSIFGFQEAWWDYRMIPDRVTGILNPNISGSLDFWTLADKALIPSGETTRDDYELLNDSFIYEGRDSIKNALVTGSSGPDYIADFYFDLTAVRELPMFSIPGLADHH